MNKQLSLYLGGNKTGSTALQQSLFLARHRLASAGVVYPDMSTLFPSKPNQHWPLAVSFKSNPFSFYMFEVHSYSESEVKHLIARARNEFETQTEASDHVILASEAFGNLLSQEDLAGLKAWLEKKFDVIFPVFYAREPNFSTFYSMFQEFVKGGRAPSAKKTIQSAAFRQPEQARKIKTVFPDCNFRVFSKEDLVEENILSDFLYSGHLERYSSAVEPVTTNSSLALESVALLFFFNYYTVRDRATKFWVRRNIVHFDQKNKASLTPATVPNKHWEAEIKLQFVDDWEEYRCLADQDSSSTNVGFDRDELNDLARRSDLLRNEDSMKNWLLPYFPSWEFVSEKFHTEFMDVIRDAFGA